MATSIKEALYGELDEKYTVIGKVYGKGEMETYQNKKDEKRTFFMIVVADASAVCKLRIYRSNSNMIAANRTYRFMDVIRKFGGFWSIGQSKISSWAPIDVPHDIACEADMEFGNMTKDNDHDRAAVGSPKKLLKQAVNSTTTSQIVGKVVQVSPLKHVRGGELPLKFVSLKDSSATVKLALFNKDAETTYKKGDVLSVNDVYRYRDTNTLSTKMTANVEFLNQDALDVPIEDSDYIDDGDFAESSESPEIEEFTIMGIDRVNTYKCCAKLGCKKKRLLSNGNCPYCREGTDARSTNGYAVCIIHHGETEDNYTIFFDELQKLIEVPQDFPDEMQNGDLMELLSRKLPIKGRGLFEDSKISIINIKRKMPEMM